LSTLQEIAGFSKVLIPRAMSTLMSTLAGPALHPGADDASTRAPAGFGLDRLVSTRSDL
jgi:hypothetical protein